MTVLPLPFTRRTTPTLPINHGAYYCGMCWTPPGVEHTRSCPEVTAVRPGLARPAEARVFRGLLYAIPASAALWAATIALIWSH